MGGKKGGNKGSGGNKSKKTLNKVQKRFKQRESQGLSGLTGLKKGTEKKGKNSTLGIYRQYQSDSIRGRAGNQEAAARAAERDREVAEIKANTRAKNLASGTDLGVTTQQNVSQASSNLGIYNNYEGQIAGKFATSLADTFANPKYMYQGNMAGRLPGLSNYFTPDVGTGIPYTKGGNLRGIPLTGGDKTGSLTRFKVPDGAKLSRSPLGVRQYKLNPTQMKNLGMGVTDDAAKFAAKGFGKYGLRAVPFVGAVPSLVDAGVRLKNKDYMGAGLSTLSAVPGKIGWASLAGLAAHDINRSMNVGDTNEATTQAGGLNTGNVEAEGNTGRALTKMSQLKDKGIERNAENDATINNKLSSLYNFSKKIPFGIGESIERNVEANKPFFNRLNVDTPRANKLTISD